MYIYIYTYTFLILQVFQALNPKALTSHIHSHIPDFLALADRFGAWTATEKVSIPDLGFGFWVPHGRYTRAFCRTGWGYERDRFEFFEVLPLVINRPH